MQPFQFVHYLKPLLQFLCFCYIDVSDTLYSRDNLQLCLILPIHNGALFHPLYQVHVLLSIVVYVFLVLILVELVRNVAQLGLDSLLFVSIPLHPLLAGLD